jgi:hypothetical protein
MSDKNKGKAKPAIAVEPVSICKQVYDFAQKFNCLSQHKEQKGGLEEVTVYPKNEKAEKITFTRKPAEGGEALILLFHKGGDIHPVLNIITDSPQVKAAALVIIKAGLEKNC